MITITINLKNVGCYDYNGKFADFKGNGFECSISGNLDRVLLILAIISIERGISCKIEGYTEITLSKNDLIRIEERISKIIESSYLPIIQLFGYYQLVNDIRTRYLLLWNIVELIAIEKIPELSPCTRIRKIINQSLNINSGKRTIIKKLFSKRSNLDVSDHDIKILEKVVINALRELLNELS